MAMVEADCVQRCNRLKLKRRCAAWRRKSPEEIAAFVMVVNAAGPINGGKYDE
jgi:hypothetical protein